MQFSKLRIQGFKTFVDATDVHIRNGLSGVVGPNGCGKSNLVEALRWVMGENSFKNMRASGMDDVIFSGSASRPSRNHAEVILTVDNKERLAPAMFNDADVLEISRKIEREAGSTYKINGREVRARDVQLLFADASTGSRSPALVRQGQIAEIISAKPQARRRVLEEAAGISGLYARRHEAETRLKGAETNLERLEDVFVGLQAQVETLRRQAKGALKYKSLSTDIRKNEATLAYARFMDILTQVIAAEKQIELERLAVASTTTKQTEAVKQQAIAQERLPNLRDAAAKAGAALSRLIVARDQLEAEEKRAKERTLELNRQISQIEADITREKSQNSDADSILTRMLAEKTQLQSELTDTQAQENTLHETYKFSESQLTQAEKTFAQATTILAEANAKRNSLERNVQDSQDRLSRVQQQMKDLDFEQSRLLSNPQDDAKHENLKIAVLTAIDNHKNAENEAIASEEAHKSARLGFEETRKPLAEAEKRVQMLDTEIRTLLKFLAPTHNKVFTPVLEQLVVQKGFERALAAALNEDLDAPIDEKSPLHWKGAEISPQDPQLPPNCEPLSTHVSAPIALSRRLSQIGVCAKGEGVALQKFLKVGQRLVSFEGDLWRWDGFTISASAQSPAARRLAEKNRLVDLEQDLLKAREALSISKSSADIAQATIKILADRETKTRDSWRAANRMIELAREHLISFERVISVTATKRAALLETRIRLQDNLSEAEKAFDGALSQSESAATAKPLEEALNNSRQEVAQLRELSSVARAKYDGFKRDCAAKKSRITMLDSDYAREKRRQDNSIAQLQSLNERKNIAVIEVKQLEEAPAYFLEKRRTLMNGITEAESNRKDTQDALAIGERMARDADNAASEALRSFSAIREGFVRAESKIDAVKQRKLEIEAQIEEQFETSPQALPEIGQFKRLDELPPLKTIEVDLERLKKERERLGGVNLQADVELEASETHLNRLKSERDDLTEAIKKLRAAIGSLNREGRERLLASFDTVNANFTRIFTQLFGGGTANLQLVESDDPLEAGLDILAMPPGKKPQTMSLLSGGEQALTAIALIFAVFLTNPAPICVLDEVDAPLDDSNVERYCDLLEEMAATTSTRFLVITHNPITMARMNRLYGVTMAERGVSQLVSVDLQKAALMVAA